MLEKSFPEKTSQLNLKIILLLCSKVMETESINMINKITRSLSVHSQTSEEAALAFKCPISAYKQMLPPMT